MIVPRPGTNCCICIVPKPQPPQQGASFWDFIQKASLLAGLMLTLRSLSE